MQLAVNCYIEIQIGYMRGYLIFFVENDISQQNV